MTLGVLDLSDKLWRGEIGIEEAHPFSLIGPVEELADVLLAEGGDEIGGEGVERGHGAHQSPMLPSV